MLFYVNPLAIKNFFDEIFAFGQQEEAMYCFTDSMRPFVDGPFADEIKSFVEGKGAEVLQHADPTATPPCPYPLPLTRTPTSYP